MYSPKVRPLSSTNPSRVEINVESPMGVKLGLLLTEYSRSRCWAIVLEMDGFVLGGVFFKFRALTDILQFCVQVRYFRMHKRSLSVYPFYLHFHQSIENRKS
jgi:hypothetical protein